MKRKDIRSPNMEKIPPVLSNTLKKLGIITTKGELGNPPV